MWKLSQDTETDDFDGSFSPLAGIRYVETRTSPDSTTERSTVSVPLRGLDMWKRSKPAGQGEEGNAFQSPCGD